MVSTTMLKYYTMVYILFIFICGGFLTIDDENYNISNLMPVSDFIKSIQGDDIFSNILKVVLAPFVIIDLIIIIANFATATFIFLPTTINVLLISPIGFFIFIDYILPMIRGN